MLRLNGNGKPLFNNRLSCIQLTAICEVLASDTTIEFLDLSYNDSTPATQLNDPAAATFGSQGAKIIARLLKMNQTLKYVILEGNAIGPEGAAALADVLSSERGGGAGIEVLNLASNPLTDQVCTGRRRATVLATLLLPNARVLPLCSCRAMTLFSDPSHLQPSGQSCRHAGCALPCRGRRRWQRC